MNPRRLPRAVLPAAAAVLCALLASCSSGSASPASPAPPSAASQVSTVSPAPSVSPSAKTLPPSRLCSAFDKSAARQVLTDPKQASRVAPGKGEAPDSCGYTSGDGSAMLTLTPSARSYAAELSAAHSLVRDPVAAGMRDVKVTEVDGLGQAAFRETAQVIKPPQDVAFVVWRAGSRTWVLTLAESRSSSGSGKAQDTDALLESARRLTPRLPA